MSLRSHCAKYRRKHNQRIEDREDQCHLHHNPKLLQDVDVCEKQESDSYEGGEGSRKNGYPYVLVHTLDTHVPCCVGRGLVLMSHVHYVVD